MTRHVLILQAEAHYVAAIDILRAAGPEAIDNLIPPLELTYYRLLTTDC